MKDYSGLNSTRTHHLGVHMGKGSNGGCLTRALGGAIMTPPEVLVTFLRGGLGRSNSMDVPGTLRPCVNNVAGVRGGRTW